MFNSLLLQWLLLEFFFSYMLAKSLHVVPELEANLGVQAVAVPQITTGG